MRARPGGRQTAARARAKHRVRPTRPSHGESIHEGVKGGIVEISAEDGSVLVGHPQARGSSGRLIWPRSDS